MRIPLGRDNKKNMKWAYLNKSYWHNPYKGDRQEVVTLFEEYARNTYTKSDLQLLTGKVLGCWCHPELCHGHIIVKLWKEYFTPK